MIFSSISFLYYFLPVTLLLYVILPYRLKNPFLLLASLVFYFSSEPRYIVVLLFSCVFHYSCGRMMEKACMPKRKALLILDLTFALLILIYFKYLTFMLSMLQDLFHVRLSWNQAALPIGISFYTFQACSYIIDIYRGKCKSAKKLTTFAMYLTLFPQLIAGPIVRYTTLEQECDHRMVCVEQFAQGIRRFLIGLAKKVMIANVLGAMVQRFAGMAAQSVLSCWLSAVAAMFQLYFDFSGYSDMAIGLGLMLGFHFPKNFNYPFIAASISDFWHRWHISLSSWFRDYVYIPLGGSRKGLKKQCRNILIVWILTGLWHGAGWNFAAWGLYFAVLLILEKRFLSRFLLRHPLFAHFYTLLLVLISFVIFHAASLQDAFMSLCCMFGFAHLPFTNIETLYIARNALAVLFIAALFSLPLRPYLSEKVKAHSLLLRIWTWSEPLVYLALLLISTAYIIDESFQPFLYFRF